MAFNVIMIVLNILFVATAPVFFEHDLLSFFLIELIFLINVSILAYSVIRIRSIVKSLHNAFPNEALVRVHLINSFVTALIWLLLTIM